MGAIILRLGFIIVMAFSTLGTLKLQFMSFIITLLDIYI